MIESTGHDKYCNYCINVDLRFGKFAIFSKLKVEGVGKKG